jgi:hypothetical protein
MALILVVKLSILIFLIVASYMNAYTEHISKQPKSFLTECLVTGGAAAFAFFLLAKIRGVHNHTTADEYLRMIAISRIMLPNIKNIQASWLTVGKQTAQMSLHGGANDFGSIMLEENVVSAAGAPHRFTYKTIQDAIREAGFEPQLRNQQYEWRTLPEQIEEQMVNY